MVAGIVNNFWWVVPGNNSQFSKAVKIIKTTLNSIRVIGEKPKPAYQENKTQIFRYVLGRKISVCTLESLLIFKNKFLLDIDTDFLVIDNLNQADRLSCISQRKPWILPKELVKLLNEKVKPPRIATIAYFVNGGYTPLKYKHLGKKDAY
jgi:hypothetical protein